MMISGKWDVTAEVQSLAPCRPQSGGQCCVLRLMDDGPATQAPVDRSSFCLELVIMSPLGLECHFLIQMISFFSATW